MEDLSRCGRITLKWIRLGQHELHLVGSGQRKVNTACCTMTWLTGQTVCIFTNRWWPLGTRSQLYLGCSKASHQKHCKSFWVAMAQYGLALSCSSRTSFLSSLHLIATHKESSAEQHTIALILVHLCVTSASKKSLWFQNINNHSTKTSQLQLFYL